MKAYLLIFGIIMTVLFESCHDRGKTPIHIDDVPTPTIETSAADSVIDWHLAPCDDEGFLSAELQLVDVIQLETTDSCLIGSITRLGMRNDSTLVVVDASKASRIYLFNRDGKFIRSVGSKGNGPGEYANINGVETFQDSVVIFDWLTNKRLVYGYDGTCIDEKQFSINYPQAISKINDSVFVSAYASYNEGNPFALKWLSDNDEVLETARPFVSARSWPSGSFLHSMDGDLLYYRTDCDTAFSITTSSIEPKFTLGLLGDTEFYDFFERTFELPEKDYYEILYHHKDSPVNDYTLLELNNNWIVTFQKGPKAFISVVDKASNSHRTYLRTDLKKGKASVPFLFYKADGVRLLSYIDYALFDQISKKDREEAISALSSKKLEDALKQYDRETDNPLICIFELKR